MTNNINKIRAARLILDAICKELGVDAPIFCEHFDQHRNPVVAVISEYEKLDYREQTIIGMRLGFCNGCEGNNNYSVCKKQLFLDCAITFEMTYAGSASRIFRKALRKLSVSLTG